MFISVAIYFNVDAKKYFRAGHAEKDMRKKMRTKRYFKSRERKIRSS